MKEEIADKRSASLKAALKLISGQGFHGTPMSQIAKNANVSIGTIYHYFSGKDDLLNALYIDIKTRLITYVLDGYDREMPVRRAFRHLFRRLLTYCMENPAELSFAEQYENSPLITEDTRMEAIRLCEPMNRLFQQAVGQELLKDLPVKVMSTLIFSSVISLAKLYLSGAEAFEEASCNQAIEAVWDMIRK